MKRLFSVEEFNATYDRHVRMLTGVRNHFLENVEARLIEEWNSVTKNRTLKQRICDYILGYSGSITPRYESFVTNPLQRIHDESPGWYAGDVEGEYRVIVVCIRKMVNLRHKVDVSDDGYVILGDKALNLFAQISNVYNTLPSNTQESQNVHD